jgi:hypothetical protein
MGGWLSTSLLLKASLALDKGRNGWGWGGSGARDAHVTSVGCQMCIPLSTRRPINTIDTDNALPYTTCATKQSLTYLLSPVTRPLSLDQSINRES